MRASENLQFDCNCLIHPFQNDPGTSQSHRVMDELLSGAAKIDARTLADLLDYFTQLSRHINYYDIQLNVSDWKSFFKESIPFMLASVINYKLTDLENKFISYNSLFDKKPTPAGLQLNAYFIFYRFINKINDWHLSIKGSGLPAELLIETLIKDRLNDPVKKFITYINAGVKKYGIRRIDFRKLNENKVWNIELTDFYSIDDTFTKGTKSKFKQINNLNEKFKTLFPVFLEAVKSLSAEAEKNLELSLIPLKVELQEKHPPHLGLLFAFLNMFRQLQDDLNLYKRKHLDFFYKNILQFKSRESVPDKANLLFEIQKALKKYLLKKGLLVKDGKDDNKQQILFSLDDEIVVNKTEIAEKRTLFLNNQTALTQTYIEGVYIAPDATKADGVVKDFADDVPKNFPTIGARLSKYADPETKIIKPYPYARLGFILASPVLYLQKGSTRTIDINLSCELVKSCELKNDASIKESDPCCSEENAITKNNTSQYDLNFIENDKIFDDIKKAINKTYQLINENLLEEASKKGISIETINKIRNVFLTDTCIRSTCCKKHKKFNNESFDSCKWDRFLRRSVKIKSEIEILNGIFKPQKAFKVFFSGEKEWINAEDDFTASFSPIAGKKFTLNLHGTLNPDKPAVTYFDKEKLKEDYNTILPLVKIELNNSIGIRINRKFRKNLKKKFREGNQSKDNKELCCLLKELQLCHDKISFYHFFRDVKIIDEIVDNNGNHHPTQIDVKVCGLKDLIVQNDENIQDVNSAILPFGTRPKLFSNFYIGSKEIFSKNWQQLWINAEWKDRPLDFSTHYAYYDFQSYEDGTTILTKDSFKIRSSVLEKSRWRVDGQKRLFKDPSEFPASFCNRTPPALRYNENVYNYSRINFLLDPYKPKDPDLNKLLPLNINSDYGFLKLTLEGISFQHERYSYVLARYMMALANLTDPARILDANTRLTALQTLAVEIKNKITIIITEVANIILVINQIIKDISYQPNFPVIDISTDGILILQQALNNEFPLINGTPANIALHVGNCVSIVNKVINRANDILTQVNALTVSNTNISNAAFHVDANVQLKGIKQLIDDLSIGITTIQGILIPDPNLKQGLPKEAYTPAIINFSIDYHAIANINDIDLIHLYPFEGTCKHEELEMQPTLFPTFCDEGTLFLGLKELVPGENVNILFQLAEATSDSESEREDVNWHYLDSNIWKPLRNGFEILDDATENLTASGIVKFAMPENMTMDNTVMPKDIYWIKASIAKNSKAVSETTGIHAQSMSVTFTNDEANDKLRLIRPLAAESISKLNEADANIKNVIQPYETFNGRLPEAEGQFYIRVSELLRHKGRAIQAFDYERLALEAFPQLFKVKCINHSFALNAHEYKNDFPYAPGYVMLAVIPDLFKLKAGNSFEPKVPVSIIEEIEAYIRKRTSPFVRFRAMNPRYEKINFCLRVQLVKGKDENYYREKLKQDLREYLAPWAVGQYDKLTFGQCVYRSDIIRFLETRDYVDFISDLRMGKETPVDKFSRVCPDTPRSILFGGEIEVCIEGQECEKWDDYICKQENLNPCRSSPELINDYCLPERSNTKER